MNTPTLRQALALREICLCAMFSALLCVCAVVTVPIGPIPVTLATLALALIGLLLPLRCAVASVVVYMLLGFCGLPVFAGGNSGFAVLLGPTGGYLWSYPMMTAVIVAARRCVTHGGKWRPLLFVLCCEAGTLLCYLCGTVQFSVYAHIGFVSALRKAVLPFLLVDALKFLLASCIAVRLERVTARFFEL